MKGKGIAPEVEPPAVAEAADVPQLHGALTAKGLRFAIAVSRYNEHLTAQLVGDAVRVLKRHGARAQDLLIVWVPGAYEIPLVAEQLAAQGRHDAIIALGAVIQGETTHADLITRAVTDALCHIARRHHVPVIDTVVVACNLEQAEARCRSGEDSRGSYAARAAMEMVHVFRALPT